MEVSSVAWLFNTSVRNVVVYELYCHLQIMMHLPCLYCRKKEAFNANGKSNSALWAAGHSLASIQVLQYGVELESHLGSPLSNIMLSVKSYRQ